MAKSRGGKSLFGYTVKQCGLSRKIIRYALSISQSAQKGLAMDDDHRVWI